MASDRLMVLLNVELVNDIVRHMHVEGVKRHQWNSSHAGTRCIPRCGWRHGTSRLERVSRELDCFCKHFSIA